MSEVDQGGGCLTLLTARVRRLREVEAGNPSFKRLEKVARTLAEEDPERGKWMRPLPKSTVCDLINGKSKKLPDWLLLRTVVDVCHLIATKSGIPIDPLTEVTREFNELWQAAKVQEGQRADAAKRGTERVDTAATGGGDVLEPDPGEASSWEPPVITQEVPLHWGRLGNLRLRLAKAGDAKAAYELAVLLACEACSKGDGERERREAEHWSFLAAYWNGRALGVVPAAGTFQTEGWQLVKAAGALALEYTEAGKPSSRFFRKAVRQAESSLRARPRSRGPANAADMPVPGTT